MPSSTSTSTSNASKQPSDKQPSPSTTPSNAALRKLDQKKSDELLAKVQKYRRGEVSNVKSIQDKKTKSTVRKTEKKFYNAALAAAQVETLLPEEAGFLVAEGMEKTYKFSQKELKSHLDLQAAEKVFELELKEFGPYYLDYTRNGRKLLIGGRKGHLASFDWQTGTLGCEFHVNETTRSVRWLHNDAFYAVAQKKYTYIYDSTGMEVHCMKKHVEVNQLEFLPYHFLLATVGNPGVVRYHDTSIGRLVAEHKTKLGPCHLMRQNPHNAVLHCGHANGSVTLWTPTMSTPIVKMLCHRGPVKGMAIDNSGYYMATSGLDGQLKIFDVRTYRELHSYYTPTPAHHLDISQKGLLAVGWGPHVHIWKDALKTKQTSPYMTHLVPGSNITGLKFVPFEDVLGVSHNSGIASLVIPGSGEANYDALELNPYETRIQRREKEVSMLLEKLPADTISLNPNFIGSVDRAPEAVKRAEQKLAWEANNNGKFDDTEGRKKMRGRSKSMRRYLNKQGNVVDAKREALRQKLEKDAKDREHQKRVKRGLEPAEKPYNPLDRFASTKKKE